MKPITVLLAEDHTIVREGLKALLLSDPGISVIAESENGRHAVELTLKLQPDVVVLDIAMPQLNGIEATRQILKQRPSTKVLILSAHSDDAYVESVMALGASGYLIKQTAAQNLSIAIHAVHKGDKFFSPSISRRIEDQQKNARRRGGPKASATPTKLTNREREVLQLVAEGQANKGMADLLGISIKTIEKHRQSLMEKLNIHETAGLTRHAITTGIIESNVQTATLLSGKKS